MERKGFPDGSVSNDAQGGDYEAPRVEAVLTSDDVEREALYGGFSAPP